MISPATPTDLVLGYAAGNVPGTAFLIAMLGALANQATPDSYAPAIVIRNSRHEPLFASAVLDAVEAVDPDLVSSIAVMIWDYGNEALQSLLMRQAGLMLAAAGDDTIASLERQRTQNAPTCRFHAHGHKASFAVIGAAFKLGLKYYKGFSAGDLDNKGYFTISTGFAFGF